MKRYLFYLPDMTRVEKDDTCASARAHPSHNTTSSLMLLPIDFSWWSTTGIIGMLQGHWSKSVCVWGGGEVA